ncbi:MAG TPA: ParA family protein [Burkholderiaceae bacterium]|nr:ParA family protein [Burkholderiaceae bacterium]
MPVFAVINPKGGVGKTTLATNLAGYCARRHSTVLGDVDRQQSTVDWLRLRPNDVAPIVGWETHGTLLRPPAGASHVIVDTPAQINGWRLSDVVRVADRILVPLQPSMFDIYATRRFLDELQRCFGVSRRVEDCVAVVGMRVDARTRAADQLARFVAGLGLPVAGYLRDTQFYVHLAAHGLTMFDVPAHRVQKDLQSWEPLLGWLKLH